MNKGALWNSIQELFEVEVYHPVVPFGDILLRFAHRLLCATPRSETVAVFGECWVPALLQNLQRRLLDKPIQHARNAQFTHPTAIRLLDFHPSHRLRLIGSASQLFPNLWPMLLQVLRELFDGHPVCPGLPLLALTCCSACLLFSSPQTSSMSRSVPARLSDLRFATSVSVPFPMVVGASLLLSAGKASSSCLGRFFCRCPLMSRAAYLPFLYSPFGAPFGPSIPVPG